MNEASRPPEPRASTAETRGATSGSAHRPDTAITDICSLNPESLGSSLERPSQFRYLDISSINRGVIDWSATRVYSRIEAPSRAQRLVRPGDVLLSTVRPGLKAHGIIRAPADLPLVASTGFAVLSPHRKSDSAYLFHQLFGNAVASQLRTKEVGSNYPAVNERDVKALRFFAPSAVQREHIGSFLDHLDEAIQKSGAVIAKLKQLRTGLLHDLLTCGIDENGELRDPTSRPQEFQESQFGTVPISWGVRTLGDACDWFSGGTPDRSRTEYWSGNIPLLTPKDMKFSTLSDASQHITKEAVNAGSRLMPEETVFIVVRGMILAHTFPVVFSTAPFAFNQDIKAIRGRDQLSNRFLALWFIANTDLFLRKTTEATHGTKKLDTTEIQRVEIAIPGLAEQNAIISKIGDLDHLIHLEQAAHLKLIKLKSGLTQDLLTGRVPIPPDFKLP